MPDDNLNKLPRAESPESVGVSSQAVIDFLDEVKKSNIELHSFMIVRHGKVAVECHWKPYDENSCHTMFSVSKSVTATAVGFAIDEGLLKLSDNVYDFFPEYVPKTRPPFANQLTVEHLLTMTSGKFVGLMANIERSDWISAFLKAVFVNEPGKKFNYMSENTYMLSAIIYKVTGCNMVDYLMPRFFEPLGIERPFWETDPRGIEAGGWGLRLHAEDMAKFIQCYLDGGKYMGKQIVPEWWVKTATAKHIEKTPGIAPDHSSGYGYQFWRNSIPNSYRADGVFAQLAVALPEYDACLVTAGGEPIERDVLETMWKFFPKTFDDGVLPEDERTHKQLQKRIEELSLPVLPDTTRRLWLEEKISGKLIKFHNYKTTSVMTTVSNFMRTKKSGKMNNVRFTFKKDYLLFTWTEKYNDCSMKVGYNGKNLITKLDIAGYSYTFASSCAWLDDGSLEIWIRPLEQTQIKKFNFRFEGNKVIMNNWCEKGLYDLALFGMDFKGIKADKIMKNIAKGAAVVLEPFLDPDIVGEFYEKIF